ncbi:MAG: hypothetical protein LBF78_04505 [Treponema sp.]|nr:hypothetical protein [Treponema sp.]
MKKFSLLAAPLLLFLGFFALAFAACSRSEPRIEFGSMELVYYPGEIMPEERYSFFIIPDDDDGIENLDELYLYHDREGLRWQINAVDWVRLELENKVWIGTRSIAMRDNESLPRGQYRAVLVNKGGERTERQFTFDAPETPRYPYPFFSASDGIYRIDSQYPQNSFICYNQEGAFVQVSHIPNPSGNINDLNLPGTVRSIALWAEDPEYHTSALTEAVSIR